MGVALTLLLVAPLGAVVDRAGDVLEAPPGLPVERAEVDHREPDRATPVSVAPPVPTTSTSVPPDVSSSAPPTVAAPDPVEAVEAPTEQAPGPVVKPPPPRPDRVAPAPDASRPPSVSEGSEAVHDGDFPDPYVLRANGSWWAFSTQVGATKVPTLRSDDLLHWEPVGDALPREPSWAVGGHRWAPSVLQRDAGFVLYSTTRHRRTGLQCISSAVSPLPQGPYIDNSEGPMVCQTARGGSIDPSPFVDHDGTPYLLWKSEGTLDGEPTRVWSQRLRNDGLALVGAPRELLHRALPWEFPIIEGPSMAAIDGRYHLLYSGNRWETAEYAVGHAVCDSPIGPCRRSTPAPVLASRSGAAGPGGQEFVRLPDGRHLLVHHAWDPTAIGYPQGMRMLHVARLRSDGDRLEIGGAWRDGATAGLLDVGATSAGVR